MEQSHIMLLIGIKRGAIDLPALLVTVRHLNVFYLCTKY